MNILKKIDKRLILTMIMLFSFTILQGAILKKNIDTETTSDLNSFLLLVIRILQGIGIGLTILVYVMKVVEEIRGGEVQILAFLKPAINSVVIIMFIFITPQFIATVLGANISNTLFIY